MNKIQEYLAVSAVIILVILGAYWAGEIHVQHEWDLDIAYRNGLLTKAKADSAQALKDAETQYHDMLNKARSQAGHSAVVAYLRSHGLLSTGVPVQPARCVPPSRDPGNDAAAQERSPGSGNTGSLAGFATDCGLDAGQVDLWRNWAITNHIPVQ